MNNNWTFGWVKHAVFLLLLGTVLIEIISIIFPALLIRSTSNYQSEVNPLEFGPWAYPILASNLIILGIAILHKGNSLPQPIIRSIKFMLSFEVSKRIAVITILALLAIYVGLSVNSIQNSAEEGWPDFKGEKVSAESFNITSFSSVLGYPLQHALLNLSMKVFGNIRIIPFISSIALLLVTYFITKEMAQKRFAGLAAVSIVIQSTLFLRYSVLATYPTFWTLFYILSLYLIYKKWYLSPFSYILSLLAKPLTLIYLPMTFFFIYRTKRTRKTRIVTTTVYVVILAALIAATLYYHIPSSQFHTTEFWGGFTLLESFMRSDGLILMFILPLVFGLYATSRRGISQADSIIVLITGALLSGPALAGFTEFSNQPYRFIPLVVFFAMGVGILFSKRPTQA